MIESSTTPALWTSAPPSTVTRDSDRRTQAGRSSAPSTARSARRVEHAVVHPQRQRLEAGLGTLDADPAGDRGGNRDRARHAVHDQARAAALLLRPGSGQGARRDERAVPQADTGEAAVQVERVPGHPDAVEREARRIRAIGIAGPADPEPVGPAAAGLDRDDHGQAALRGPDLQVLAGGEPDVQVLAVDAVAGDLDHRGRDVAVLAGRPPGVQRAADAGVAARADPVSGRGHGRKRPLVAAAADRADPQVGAGHRDLFLGRMTLGEGDPAELRIDADPPGRRPLMPPAEVGHHNIRTGHRLAAAVHADAARGAVVVLEPQPQRAAGDRPRDVESGRPAEPAPPPAGMTASARSRPSWSKE